MRNQYLPATEVKEAARSYLGVRHLQCLLLFLGLAVGYTMRVNLSVAIVAITDRNGTNLKFQEYNWSEETKSYVLSSFFWGYVFTQIPAGQLADKYGPKTLLLGGILINSILALFTPLIVHYGDWQWLCLARLTQGFSQGMLFPSTHALLSKWVLVEERGALCGFCYAGTLFGAFFIFSISGFLADSPLGWPGIFYITAALGLSWVLFWSLYGANKPEDYESMSENEKLLIERSLNQQNAKCIEKFKTPWRKILTTPAVWVLTFVHAAHTWGFWTLLTELPTYMKEVLKTNIKQNALLAALPYLVMLLLSIVFISISKKLAKKTSASFNRKLLNTIGQWIPALALTFLAFYGAESLTTAVSLLVLAIGINAASFSGFQVNHIDLSPNFAGVLMGITNAFANLMSIVAPLVVGLIVKDETNPKQWRLVFLIAAGFYFLGNLLFILFGKANVQSWNNQSNQDSLHNVEMQNLTITK